MGNNKSNKMKEIYFLFIGKNTVFSNQLYEIRSDNQGLKYIKLNKIYEQDSIRIVR